MRLREVLRGLTGFATGTKGSQPWVSHAVPLGHAPRHGRNPLQLLVAPSPWRRRPPLYRGNAIGVGRWRADGRGARVSGAAPCRPGGGGCVERHEGGPLPRSRARGPAGRTDHPGGGGGAGGNPGVLAGGSRGVAKGGRPSLQGEGRACRVHAGGGCGTALGSLPRSLAALRRSAG